MTRNEKRRSWERRAPASPTRRSSRKQPNGTGAERKTRSIAECHSSVKSLNYMGLDTSTEWDFRGWDDSSVPPAAPPQPFPSPRGTELPGCPPIASRQYGPPCNAGRGIDLRHPMIRGGIRHRGGSYQIAEHRTGFGPAKMSHAESAESSEKAENPKQFLLTLMTLREIQPNLIPN